MNDVGGEDYMRMPNFPLSLTSTAFVWFTSLPHCIIDSWLEVEKKFCECFKNTLLKKRWPSIALLTENKLLVDAITKSRTDSSKFWRPKLNNTIVLPDQLHLKILV